jgi:hypothetical protein
MRKYDRQKLNHMTIPELQELMRKEGYRNCRSFQKAQMVERLAKKRFNPKPLSKEEQKESKKIVIAIKQEQAYENLNSEPEIIEPESKIMHDNYEMLTVKELKSVLRENDMKPKRNESKASMIQRIREIEKR